jgi:hypothetical protein
MNEVSALTTNDSLSNDDNIKKLVSKFHFPNFSPTAAHMAAEKKRTVNKILAASRLVPRVTAFRTEAKSYVDLDEHGRSALWYACRSAHDVRLTEMFRSFELFKLLHALMDLPDYHGITPRQAAMASDDPKLMMAFFARIDEIACKTYEKVLCSLHQSFAHTNGDRKRMPNAGDFYEEAVERYCAGINDLLYPVSDADVGTGSVSVSVSDEKQ